MNRVKASIVMIDSTGLSSFARVAAEALDRPTRPMIAIGACRRFRG